MAEDDELLESVGGLDGAREHGQLRIDRADDGGHVGGVHEEVEDLFPGQAAARAKGSRGGSTSRARTRRRERVHTRKPFTKEMKPLYRGRL